MDRLIQANLVSSILVRPLALLALVLAAGCGDERTTSVVDVDTSSAETEVLPDPCAEVVCDAPPPCRGPGECAQGVCSYPPVSGGACDDADPCTTADTCNLGVCVGTPIVCEAPPAPVCSDASNLELFASPGRCDAGECAYARVETPCDRGCVAGACAGDPCAGVVCDAPPSACHAPVGVCQSGVCSYAALTGASCDDGDACTTSDRCGADAACAGVAVRCDSAPAAACADDATLTAYAETGVCEAGACTYEAVAVACGGGCNNGGCAEDPCVGVVCDAPPSPCHEATGACVDGVCRYAFDDGASCDDGDACSTNDRCQAGACDGAGVICDAPGAPTCSDVNTLRVPANPGMCSAGQCSYGTVDVACSFGCVDGACAGDPCSGVVCDAPEAPTCTGPKTLRSASPGGVCANGACVYETTLMTCLHGCAAGACTPPVGVVISEVLYDSAGHPDVEAFIELHGPPGTPVDGLALVGVNGNGGADYSIVVLSGALDAAGLYVVAHPEGDAALVADLTDPDVDMQNSPDSIQLRFGTTVLDALAYGTFGANNIAAGEGAPAAMTPVGESLQRDASYTDTNVNAVDFVVADPTPGAPFVDTSCDEVLNPGCDCLDGATRPCGEDRGTCELGSQTCDEGAWGTCSGGVGPGTETCDGVLDQDCDGAVDEGCDCVDGASRPCGEDRGVCELGSQSCAAGAWGACAGGVGPGTETCDGVLDQDCDGTVDEGCDCVDGATRPCGEDEGACELGSEACASGAWGACTGGVGPSAETCEGAIDEDCDGDTDEGCSSNDPFEVGSCSGTPLTQAEAMALLNGASRVVLATAIIQRRARTCGDCAWGAASDWTIQYLTYSGGVTTRWKPLLTRMNLVLFLDQGTPKLSMQHETFVGSGYTDKDGMVYGLSPTPLTFPHIRAWNHSPSSQYDYIELDYQVKAGTLVLGDGCARWTADPFGQGQGPYTEGFATRFGW